MKKWWQVWKLSSSHNLVQAEAHALSMSRRRMQFVLLSMMVAYLTLIMRLFDVALFAVDEAKESHNKKDVLVVNRASIVDRNGKIIATNLRTASLYVNPQKISQPDKIAVKLCSVLQDLSCDEVREKLQAKHKSFVWLARHLSPKEQQLVHNLAIPGLDFMREEKRVYPHGSLFSHIIGFVDIDSKGMAGVERTFDQQLQNEQQILQLSLDIRVQQVLKEELSQQIREHSAVGGAGIVMDVNTGEVIAMVSLPDFDPNHPADYPDKNRFNQTTLGIYEMGSTFKIITAAMGLENKRININDAFNTDAAVMVGKYRISDYRGKGGYLSVPEILMYSSNIGTAQIAMRSGVQEQKEFLNALGILRSLPIELAEKAGSMYPRQWNHSHLITISYGHGIATTPLHAVNAFATIVNGGHAVKPTVIKQHNIATGDTVLSRETSNVMRKLLRLTVAEGFGKKANMPGLAVGGKTGTAEKLVNGRYSKNANLASFVGAFPMHAPRYALLVMIDEAKKNELNMGFTTGGMIAAPVAGKIIERIAPLLQIMPIDDATEKEQLALHYQARYQKAH